ncbi:hypothetical protein EI94DRAFT_1795844 [Lactarius quietus]|nr:hypothetical protein EI94DRAFT_1795844 [Lactarius quietus]
MSNHLENPRLARTPAGGSSSYPSEPIPQNFPWPTTSHPCPAGYPATAHPDYVHGSAFVAPGDPTYRADPTPLYPWKAHSDALKAMIRNLMLQIDSEVVEVRKETRGLSRSRVTVVFETPDEI